MKAIVTIGLDLAKNVFQVHGVDDAGNVLVRRQLRRAEVLRFFSSVQPSLVGIEACGSSHYWAREIEKLGHTVKLMPAGYVKPYVKRGKTDAADAEAICEAVTRPTMRFVAAKSAEQQSVLMMHKVRELLVRQRTMLINSLRGHLSEFGIIGAGGAKNVPKLVEHFHEMQSTLPEVARTMLWVLDRSLFHEITGQLKAKAIKVKTGTLVDATIIASASEEDGEAHWVKHKGKPAVHGFKAHVGADADTALVEEIAVTPANINDGRAGPDALPDDPGEVYADSAYRGNHFGDAVRAKGGTPKVVATGMWGRNTTETLKRLDAWNRPIHRVRGRIEKIFGTWKRSYGLRRMRWRGLAKAACQVHLTAVAYNLRRGLTLATAR